MRPPFMLLAGPQTFQTFVDDPTSGKVVPRQLHGTLEQWHERLQRENEALAGIYYTVNLTREAHRVFLEDSSSQVNARKAEDILLVRAWYTDIDGIPGAREKRAVVRQLLEHPACPSVIIETRNGIHALWYAEESTEADSAEYQRTEQGIIRYWGGDEGAKDIARVLRMPGFLHQKNPQDPFLVRVVFEDVSLVYAEADIRGAFPPPAAPVWTGGRSSFVVDGADDWGKIVGALVSWRPEAQRRHLVMTIALGVALKFGVSEQEAVQDLEGIVTTWPTGRDMSAELRRTARWAYERGTPATVSGLRGLGVRVPKLSRPDD